MKTTNNYQIIDDIIQYDETMYELYLKLAELENNNQKNSKEYNETIELIIYVLQTENKKYNIIQNMNIEKILEIRRYIIQKYEIYTKETTIDTIMDGDEKTYSFMRAYSYLNSILDRKDSEIDYFESGDDSIEIGMNIAEAVNQTVELLLIKNIEKLISKEKYIPLKEQLVREKYSAIFIDKTLENKILYYKFDLSKIEAIFSKNTLKFNNIDEDNYLLYLNETGKIYLKEELSTLLKINDEYYNEAQGLRDAKMVCALLQASFDMISENEYLETANYTYHEIIEDQEYLSKKPTSKNSEKLIENAFKEKRLKYR